MAGGYNSLPELNTNYGPNYLQVVQTAKAIKEMRDQEELKNLLAPLGQQQNANAGQGQNALAAGANYQNVGQNLLSRGHVDAAKTVFAIGQALKKVDDPSVMKTELENMDKTLAYVAANPGSYPEVYQKGTAKGIPLPNPDTFIGQDGQVDAQKFGQYLLGVKQGMASFQDRVNLNTPSIHNIQVGDQEVPVALQKGAGMAGIKAIPGAGGPKWEGPKASTSPMHVQDPNSPTGWSYADLLGNVTPGAPTPASDTNVMDPFKANQRISAIQKDRTVLAGSLEKLKKGDLISNALAQFMNRPELAGTTATDDMVKELGGAYDKASAQWDNEVKLLEPYAKATPAQKPGVRSISQGGQAAKPSTSPAKAASTQPQYIRNKTTGEVRKWNPSTKQYEAVQ